MAKYKAKIRIGLMVTLIVCVILCPLAWGGYSVHYAAHAQDKRDDPIEFTPHVTEIVLTVTPEPAVLDDLRPQPSPVPIAPTTPRVVGTPEPTMPTHGGDETIGYAMIHGSDPPMWRVWFEGEEFYISPNDPAAIILLNQFMIAAEERSTKIGEAQSADFNRNQESGSITLGVIEGVLGIIVTLGSCGGCTWTWPLAGGSCWVCAAGLGGIGVGGVTTFRGFDRVNHHETEYLKALEAIESETNEARMLFRILSGYSD